MDIAGPQGDEEVAPEPKKEILNELDVPQLVDETIHEHGDLTPDEIVELLAKRGIQVSGILVASQLMKRQAEAAD